MRFAILALCFYYDALLIHFYMKKPKPLALDLTASITKILSLNLEQSIKFDSVLLTLANKIYLTYDFICDDRSDFIKSVSVPEAKIIIDDLSRIKKQSTNLLGLLNKMNLDSKNMDRIENMLSEIKNDSAKLIIILNRKITS